MILLALLLAAQPANLPEVPKDVPQDAARETILMMGIAAGQQAVWTTPDGKLRTFYQYNDRGRGPKTYSTITFGKDGVPATQVIEGNDYMKDPVDERFSVEDGVASWKSKAEQGRKKLSGPAFYAAMYGPDSDFALLARVLLDHGGRLALLPDGEARIEKVADQRVEVNGKSQQVSLYAVTGLGFSPAYLWLDAKRAAFASGGTWQATVREGWESVMPALIKAQQEAQQQRARQQAQRLAHKPQGKLVFHDVAVFDAELALLELHHDVIIEGNRILSVAPTQAAPAGAEIIEGAGKTLIPGLWDMHAHVSGNDGLLNLAAGVTSVRDLANDTDELLARKKRIESGEELGTRIVMAGFMDGPGPYQGPTKILISTEKEGRDQVDKYAALGCVQVKLYSSLKPELVAPIAEQAHKRGMRVSGHIPAFMSAAEAVRAGYDEVQHVNMLLLNFMPDVKDTRTPARFLEPAKRAAELDVKSPQVREFIRLLQDRHTTLDLTLSIFESMFLDRAGTLAVGMAPVADRLPVQVRRGLMAGNLPVPQGMDETYKKSWQKTLQLVRELYLAGIPIEAGTDSLAGFALHRELELDVQAGIPPAEAIRLASYGAARIMGKDFELGLIRPAMLADVVLIDGDPTARISEVRKASVVVKDGVVYRPAELYQELGVRP
jgi:imidazolonepropionase-like amidohydrolase